MMQNMPNNNTGKSHHLRQFLFVLQPKTSLLLGVFHLHLHCTDTCQHYMTSKTSLAMLSTLSYHLSRSRHEPASQDELALLPFLPRHSKLSHTNPSHGQYSSHHRPRRRARWYQGAGFQVPCRFAGEMQTFLDCSGQVVEKVRGGPACSHVGEVWRSG